MCLPYLKDKAESFSDTIVNNTPNGLIVLNEKLEVQQINDAALKIMNIRSGVRYTRRSGGQNSRSQAPFMDVLNTRNAVSATREFTLRNMKNMSSKR